MSSLPALLKSVGTSPRRAKSTAEFLYLLTSDKRWRDVECKTSGNYAIANMPHGDTASFAICHAFNRLPGATLQQDNVIYDIADSGRTRIAARDNTGLAELCAWLTPLSHVYVGNAKALGMFKNEPRMNTVELRLFTFGNLDYLYKHFGLLKSEYQMGLKLASASNTRPVTVQKGVLSIA